MSRTYEYRRLPPGRVIRVLHLQPSSHFDSPIDCLFEETNLDNPNEKWEAVSYVWGSTVSSHKIICEGRTIFINENCHAALRRLRRKDRIRIVWIDAVCINQNSIEERNHQVKIMGDVYRNASRVLIWLGEEEQFAPTLRFLRWLGLVFKALDQARITARGLRTKFNIVRCRNIIELIRFFDNSPWNSRVWTFQENILARQKIICIGSASIPGTLFHTCTEQLNVKALEYSANSVCNIYSTYPHIHIPPAWTMPHQYSDDRARSSTGGRILTGALLQIITMGWRRLASEPRDKVYGMHTLLSDIGIKLRDPDYNLPVETLYEEFTTAIIQASSSLRILELNVGVRNLSALPSWVPDLSIEGIINAGMLDSSPLDSFRSTYRAEVHNGVLRVLGKRVTVVDAIFDAAPGPLYDFRSEDLFTPSVYLHRLGIFLYTFVQESASRFQQDELISLLIDAILCCVERRLGSRALYESVKKGVAYAFVTCKQIFTSPQMRGPKVVVYKDGVPDAVWFGDLCQYEFGRAFVVCVQAQLIRDWGDITALYLMLRGMRLIFTSGGPSIALTSGIARQSDIIVALDGLGVPVILRKAGENFEFIGLAYCKTPESNYPSAEDNMGTEFFSLV